MNIQKRIKVGDLIQQMPVGRNPRLFLILNILDPKPNGWYCKVFDLQLKIITLTYVIVTDKIIASI